MGKSFVGMNYKLLDPDENGEGEVATYGRNVFMGYIWEEKKTREALTDDGEFWMKSGDIGRYGTVISYKRKNLLNTCNINRQYTVFQHNLLMRSLPQQ